MTLTDKCSVNVCEEVVSVDRYFKYLLEFVYRNPLGGFYVLLEQEFSCGEIDEGPVEHL